MKTENLRIALETMIMLSSYVKPLQFTVNINGNDETTTINPCNVRSIAKRAQQELSELQRLVDVVKGFIEDNEITDSQAIYSISMPKYRLIEDLCNIVGYKE